MALMHMDRNLASKSKIATNQMTFIRLRVPILDGSLASRVADGAFEASISGPLEVALGISWYSSGGFSRPESNGRGGGVGVKEEDRPRIPDEIEQRKRRHLYPFQMQGWRGVLGEGGTKVEDIDRDLTDSHGPRASAASHAEGRAAREEQGSAGVNRREQAVSAAKFPQRVKWRRPGETIIAKNE